MAGRAISGRTAVVALALALVVVALAAQCWLRQFPRDTAHPDHPLATSIGNEFVINLDHPHVLDNATPLCPEQFAPAVLPRSASPAFSADIVAAAVGIAGSFSYPVLPAVRGPPAELNAACTGQDLLTRYCLARR